MLCEQPVAKELPKVTTSSQEGSDKVNKVTTVVRCKNEVLKQTTRAFVYTANDGLILLRILMDIGSQFLHI